MKNLEIFFFRRTTPLRLLLGHMVIGFKQVRVLSGNLVSSPSAENHLLSLSGQQIENKHFRQVREQALFAIFRNVH